MTSARESVFRKRSPALILGFSLILLSSPPLPHPHRLFCACACACACAYPPSPHPLPSPRPGIPAVRPRRHQQLQRGPRVSGLPRATPTATPTPSPPTTAPPPVLTLPAAAPSAPSMPTGRPETPTSSARDGSWSIRKSQVTSHKSHQLLSAPHKPAPLSPRTPLLALAQLKIGWFQLLVCHWHCLAGTGVDLCNVGCSLSHFILFYFLFIFPAATRQRRTRAAQRVLGAARGG